VLADGVERPGVDGATVADALGAAAAEVLADEDVLGFEVPDALAGAGAPWKSTQDSVRTVLPPTVTLRAFGVIM
jgi:hypothetical protein